MTIFLYFIHDKNKSKPINIFLDNSDLHRYLSQTRTRTYTYSKRKTIKSKWENWAVILNIWIWHHGSFLKDLGLIYWKKINVFLCYSYALMRITSGFQCFFFKDNWNECLKKLTLIMIVSHKFMRRRTDHNFPWRTKHACQLIVHNTNTEQTFALRNQINCKQGHTIDSVEFHPSTSCRNPPWLFWK